MGSVTHEKLVLKRGTSINKTPSEDKKKLLLEESFGSDEDSQSSDGLPMVAKSTNIQFRSRVQGTVPAYRAVFLISNAALGAGLLDFPQAYMKAGGITNAIIIQLVLLVPILGTFMILAHCANKCSATTYQDVVAHSLGHKWKNVVQVCILVYFFGSAMMYQMIIGAQLSEVLIQQTGKDAWYTDHRFLMVAFSLVFLMPLVMPRRVKALSYTSFFGGIGALFITGVIIYQYYCGGYPVPSKPTVQWQTSLGAIPVICFGFQCHVSSVVVYSELKNRSQIKFFFCALIAMVVCSVCYILSGSFGYMTFGANTKSDILDMYGADRIVSVARVSIVLILLTSFAIVSFCARTVVDGLVLQAFPMSEERMEKTERKRRMVETFVWFVVTLLIAANVPGIGVAIALIGAIAGLFIFVFPGLMLFATVDSGKPKFTRKDQLVLCISTAYIVFGTFIFGQVVCLAISDDIKGKNLY